MSCGVPRRLIAIRSTNALCPSSPYPAHCLSEAALERTKPGATLLTVIPNGPSSCPSCRVKPTTACFAEQYAWMPVSEGPRPAPELMLIIRPLPARFMPQREGGTDVDRENTVPIGV